MAESFLKLVAIATVADVVPLTGENRIIVKHGLSGLGDVRNPGLRALLDVAGFHRRRGVPTARQVAFQIAPRLNAAGRMDTAQRRDRVVPHRRSRRAPASWPASCTTQNAERQQAEAEIREICEQCARVPIDDAPRRWSITAEDWHRGVLGIVASRLVERFHRPVFVLGRNPEDGLAQGSGRSIPAFHLLEALESMPDLFVRFGGHRHAAGRDAGRRARGRIPRAASTPTPPRGCRPKIWRRSWKSTPCWISREIDEAQRGRGCSPGALRPRQSARRYSPRWMWKWPVRRRS